MGAIQVKNVPEDLHDELRQRAENEGTSISEYVLRLIRRELSLPTTDEWFAMLKANPPLASDAAPDVVAEIDEARNDRDAHIAALIDAEPPDPKESSRGKRRR